jgi:AraC family transcriptional regulator
LNYYLERIQRGVDYVETRLDEEIALSSVAKEAGISQWHFQRIFKALTGETLKTYIRSRRLAGSLDRLLTTDLRVLDIALLAGFESQEAFARAFAGASPSTPSAVCRLQQRGRRKRDHTEEQRNGEVQRRVARDSGPA